MEKEDRDDLLEAQIPAPVDELDDGTLCYYFNIKR